MRFLFSFLASMDRPVKESDCFNFVLLVRRFLILNFKLQKAYG
jgi:hypothetical protein